MTAILIRLGLAAVAASFLFWLFLLFVWLPVFFYADAECLRSGYPKALVSMGLERYCTTLDGVITVKVVKP